MRILKKKCLYCHLLYRPDPRTATFQKACTKASCREQRKQAAQTKFVKDNPDYYKGQYGRLQPWLAEHPGYLSRYRAKHPKYRQKNRVREQARRRRLKAARVDIQVTIARREIEGLRALKGMDIQDTTRRRIDGLLDLLAQDRRVDIQVSSAYRPGLGVR
jgi:hypothetical protein